MVYFDSHCHLNDEAFQDDLEQVISSAKEKGIKAILVLGYDIPACKKAIEIAETHDIVYAGVGIHPQNIDGYELDVLDEIEALAHHPKVKAIGEVGLDYYWDNTPETKARQCPFFIKQIELANKLHLPLSIHAREALEDTYNILSEHRPTSGAVLHCYSGSVEMMARFAKLDLYFGFDGPITYKNAVTPKACVSACLVDRLLTETDSPYLTPVPYRGKRNDPSYIPYIFAEMAKIKGLNEEELAKRLNANISRLFHVEL